MRRVLSFLLPIAVCAAVIFVLFFGMLYFFNVFPFSDRTVSQYDLLAQIVPYAEHLFDVFKGEASLFYSYRVGGGMDVFGTLAYCLLSPFTFLFLLFGEGNVYYAASVILPVKLTCIAAAAIVMIRVRFPDMHVLLTVPVALLYAFCGYMFVANTYINWMDFLIYAPLGVLAFEYMCRTGRIRWFSLVIAACIYTCFSIACFSMFISYPVFVLYAFTVVEKSERKGYLFRLFLAYFCGVLAALPVMVPGLIAVLRSGRSGGLFSFLSSGLSTLPYLRKFSYIFSDSLFVLLIAAYFVRTRFRTGESRFLGLAGLLIMMPVLVDECCLLMNMGSYLSYALRFGFLNAVYELYIACLMLEKIRFGEESRFSAAYAAHAPLYDEKEGGMPVLNGQERAVAAENGQKGVPAGASLAGTETVRRKRRGMPAAEGVLVVLLAALALFAVAVIVSVYFVVRGSDRFDLGFLGLSSWIESLKEQSAGFSSSFAHSEGGLGGIAVLFAAVALVAVPAMFFHKFRLVRMKFIYPCLAVVLFAQVCFYGSQLVCGNIFNPIRYNEYNSLYSQVGAEEAAEEHYRVKDCGAYLSDNQSLITDTSAYTMFSSVADYENYAANIVFGYNGNGINTLKGGGGTVFGDCLLGYKYYFYQTENGGTLDREYLEKAAQEEHFAMYENTIVFPSAFTVSSADMGVTTDYDEYFDNMQNLYEFLGGEGEVFTTYSIEEQDVSYVTVEDEETGEDIRVVFVKVRLNESGDPSFYADFPADRNIRYYTGSYSDSYDISSVKTYTYHDADPSRYYYMYLYSADPDDALTVEEVLEHCSVKFISVDTLSALSERLWERAQTYTVENTLLSTSYCASVTAEEGEYLFLNTVGIDGMKAYVNGKEAELIENGLNMILVPLEAGENEVEIVYVSPYPVYGLIAAGVAAAMLVAVAFIRKKKETWVRAAEKPVAVLAAGLAALVVLVFMVVPTAAFIVKLIVHFL